MAIPTYVPLIISLFALVVPILNLLRILFETADGYRKCSEAVIGPWSKLRWRRWSWSEFRFEVHFVTPKLELQDISEMRLKEVPYQERFLTLRDRVPKKEEGEVEDTNPRPAGSKSFQPWYRRISIRHWKFFNSAKQRHALLQSGNVLDACLTHDFDNGIISMERRSTLSAMRGDEEQVNSPSVKHRFVSDQRVSWLSFLRHLYRVQNGNVSSLSSQAPSDCGPDPWASLLEKPECANRDLSKHRHPTGVAVSFVEWTWDSLPSKSTRPMATTTLGTLVVMATRLGMQWRIDLEEDSYQASGNGYSLSCTQVPEMGLVATFTAEERDHRRAPHALAFNHPTDKFMCGIIPGATLLVDEDFYCTDDAGETDVLNVVLNAIDRSGWLRQHWNLQPDDGSHKDQTRWTDMLSNEITALLCEFLPHEGANDHVFSGWKESADGMSMCLLNSPQFFRAFQAYMDDNYRECPQEISIQMSKLAQLTAGGDDEKLTQYAQHVFERTTLYLVSRGLDQTHYRQKFYLHMIAAHCNLNLAAWKATLSYLRDPTFLERRIDHPWELHDQQDISKENKAEKGESDTQTRTVHLGRYERKTFKWEGNTPPLEIEVEVFARKYIEEVEKRPGARAEYLERVGSDDIWANQVIFSDAWPVMMLRGFAWFAAKNKRGKLTPARRGGAIPSSFWDNQRPVWII
jgi:hypothetical protein